MNGMEKNFIEQAVKNYKHERAFFFQLTQNLKTKQLQNAVKHIAPKEKVENIVAFMDTTLIGSGKKGIVLTKDTLYFNDILEVKGNSYRKSINLERLCKVKSSDERSFKYLELYRHAKENDKNNMYLDRIS